MQKKKKKKKNKKFSFPLSLKLQDVKNLHKFTREISIKNDYTHMLNLLKK